MATVAAPVPEEAGRERRGQVYVALAAVAWSTAGVLQRQLSLDLPTQIGGRAVFAALALLAYVGVAERGRFVDAWRSIGWAGVCLAACLAVASGAFIAALDHTTVARVLLIQASSPVLAALLARILLGESISRRTAVALGLAIAGVAVMLGGPGDGDPAGDGLALLMSFSFALALVITRHRRDVSMAPATCLSQVFLVLAFLPFIDPGQAGAGDLVVLGFLGGGQIGLGLVLLTIGARLIPAAQVGLITLLEVVLGPLWVWMALGERPGTSTLAGGAIVVAAIVYQTREPSADGPGRSLANR
jgi:drug/metabolite transporter (DMT)-like permease